MPTTEQGTNISAMFENRFGGQSGRIQVLPGAGGPSARTFCGAAPAMIGMMGASRGDPRAFLQHGQSPNSWLEASQLINSLQHKLQNNSNANQVSNNVKNSCYTSDNSTHEICNYLPDNIPQNPRLWSRSDVNCWIEWCEKEFSFSSIDMNVFAMNGKALCLLNKQDFRDRVPSSGDVLHNALQAILKNVSHQNISSSDIENSANRHRVQPVKLGLNDRNLGTDCSNPTSSPTPSNDSGNHSSINSPESSTRHLSASPTEIATPVQNSRFTFSDECNSDMEEDHYGEEDSHNANNTEIIQHNRQQKTQQLASPTPQECPPGRDTFSSGRLLWDFLQQLLNDPEKRYRNCIVWRDSDLRIFKIVDPQSLAKLWGIHKNHLNMNFDKMSRALRYYYRVNILRKEHGEKHCYRFLRHPAELRYCRQKSLLNIPPKALPDPPATHYKPCNVAFPSSNIESPLRSPIHPVIPPPRQDDMPQPPTQVTTTPSPPAPNDEPLALNLQVKNEPNSPKH